MRKIFVVLILIFICGFASAEPSQINMARQGTINYLERLEFVSPSISQTNDIEILSQGEGVKGIEYRMDDCHPLELREMHGKTVYRPNKNKSVKYITSLRVRDKGRKLEMKVNGHHVISAKYGGLHFKLIDNCTKWIPNLFIAGSDQEYLGVQVKKGSAIKNPRGLHRLEWGKIAESGYLSRWETYSVNDKLKDLNFAKKYYSPIINCTQVTEPGSEKPFYIFDGKKIEYEKGHPRFWPANSKYLGHRLCSEQPEAIVDCHGTYFLGDGSDAIFGIDASGEMFSKEVIKEYEYEEPLKKAKVLGKKCDEVVAQYEKKTGKKVKISPLYPEELLKK